jgi:hypothetical protein
MESQNEIYGTLFNTIKLNNEDHLELILSTMDKEHALFYLIESIKFAYSKGCYTMGETEVISKSIRTILKDDK